MKFDDNVECQVICDGEHLTEYQERSEDNAKGRSCYIISEVGKRFFVRVKSLPRSSAQQTDLSAELWIDGQHMRNRPICEDGCDMDGVRTARSTVKPFIFTSITLTDDDSALQEGTAIVNELGTICIKVYRVREYRDAGSSYTARSLKMQNTPVHERSKKAGGHRVTLGEAQANERKSAMEIIYFDRKDSPYYTFTWRYRSKGILQAQGIVPLDSNTSSSKRPRSSSPSRSGGSQAFKRTRTEHTPLPHGSGSQMKLEDVPTAPKLQARAEALRAQRAALEAQKVALNEELRQANPGGVKRERSPIVLHGARSDDVIDLTEDD